MSDISPGIQSFSSKQSFISITVFGTFQYKTSVKSYVPDFVSYSGGSASQLLKSGSAFNNLALENADL